MKTQLKIGDTVKYKTPLTDEENLTFVILEIHPKDTNIREKLLVQLVCDLTLKPTFCYFSDEFISI